MRKSTQRRGDKQESRFREGRRGTHVLLGTFTILCVAPILLGCGNNSPDPTANAVTFEVGEIKVVDDRRQLLADPLLVQVVNDAFTKYTELPAMESCVDLASWYRDGIETVLEGNLLKLMEDDTSIVSARGILLQVVTIFNDAMVEILEVDPSVCSRNNYLKNLDRLPEAGPVGVAANSLLESRGGIFDSSPSTQLGSALKQVGHVPGIDYEQVVNDAFTKYTELPAMESCVDLASWYRDGIETVLEGNLLKLMEDDTSIVSASTIIGRVMTRFTDAMVEMLKNEPSICSRADYLHTLESLPEAGPVSVAANSLRESRGGSSGSSPAAQLGLALELAEGVLEFEVAPNVEP